MAKSPLVSPTQENYSPKPKPPAPSQTYDDTSHNTSPVNPQAPQEPSPGQVPVNPSTQRVVTGRVFKPTLPDHVTKHPNPVGRPKNPRP